jgi:hypothetical protein
VLRAVCLSESVTCIHFDIEHRMPIAELGSCGRLSVERSTAPLFLFQMTQ